MKTLKFIWRELHMIFVAIGITLYAFGVSSFETMAIVLLAAIYLVILEERSPRNERG